MGAIQNLSASEQIVYDALVRAAENCEPCPRNEDLADVAGFNSVGGMADVVSRLEHKGLIEAERFQRTRQVCIVATGKCTARPMNTAPHWRDRPKDMPTPAPHAIRQREPTIAQQIEKWATSRGVQLSDALADLVFMGWEVETRRANAD